ncbi:MAG: hypothetical protein EBS19_09645 [Spirochaetia bacterium]|nr:hypothetical protein [Spirochaetia bacterium]
MGKKFSFLILIFISSVYGIDFISQDFFGAKINWNEMNVSFQVTEKLPRVIIDTKDIEYGKPGTAFNISEARNKAQLKAREKINLQLVRSIETIRVDDDYTIIQKIQNDPIFREKVNEYFQLEKSELKVNYNKDRVTVESVLPLKGQYGLINFIDLEFGTEKFPELIAEDIVRPSNYTGLVLDARHLDAEPSLFPRITTEKGIEIYSYHLVNKNSVIDNGMVLYQSNPAEAINNKRVGKNPLYILALTTVGKNKTGYSITSDDAKSLLVSKETKNALRKCSVIILLQNKQ